MQVGREGKLDAEKTQQQHTNTNIQKIHYNICVNALKPFDIIRCNSLVCSKRIERIIYVCVFDKGKFNICLNCAAILLAVCFRYGLYMHKFSERD